MHRMDLSLYIEQHIKDIYKISLICARHPYWVIQSCFLLPCPPFAVRTASCRCSRLLIIVDAPTTATFLFSCSRQKKGNPDLTHMSVTKTEMEHLRPNHMHRFYLIRLIVFERYEWCVQEPFCYDFKITIIFCVSFLQAPKA